ncbi:RagB/SusD family nutrient uptake outer membrane protein [Algoriphagus winogradskyi]|uniref:Starch-binding associating with outer membrane n=1 Tax=Algoriphagus winogradskyi TaxID=237017 RepID=A0ABY1P2S6_9BACT|nr:RagB/SusD family nutrient uptake outer membrane protein [Algoriphagus winogradskyi]SMP25092.1 Starch-binding associating with outer membrane [Algoriphagus winogradskyi]
MKNILSIFAIALILVNTGCADFLEEDNRSNVTAEEFYATEEGYAALINSNYSALRNIYGKAPWMFMSGTDLYEEGRSPEPQGLSKYSQLNSSSEGVDFLYTNSYKAIQLANTAIYYADKTAPSPNIAQYVGEVRFLRANAYFLLVQSYGGVGIITDFIAEPILSFDRSSAEEVYSLIISELEIAMNEVSFGDYTGRVNKRAVENLLAKVHLTRAYEDFAESDDFAKAASYAENVIAGQGLNLSSEELWTPGNDMNEEVIFSVQFSPGSISSDPSEIGNQQQNYNGPYLGGSEVAGNAPYKTYNLLPTRFALDLFEETDERWYSTFMTEMYVRYYDYYDVADKSSLTVRDFYEPRWFTAQDSIDYMAAHPTAIYHSYGTTDPVGGIISGDRATMIVKKFDDPNSLFAGSGNGSSTRDFIISRLAETYLVAAEAYLGLGEAAKGLEKLNVVRQRAGVADATMSDFDLDYILDERARELLGENHRWFDLKRTGKLIERASAYNSWITPANFQGAGGNLKILRPIPQAALDLNQNKDFPQNPAYD